MDPFKLRESFPKIAELNKPLLLGVIALVLFFLLWALFAAFAPPPHRAAQEMSSSGRSDTLPVSPLLSALPKNYEDVNTIKKYVAEAPSIAPEVTQELNQLQAEESALQSEMQQLHQHPAANDAGDTVDGATDSARKSDLFFSSTKPPQSLMDPNANKSSSNNPYNNNAVSNTAYAQQNMQAQKNAFLNGSSTQGDVYNQYQMLKPASPYEVQAGTIVAANLLTAVNTSLPGDVIAQVRQDVYDTVSGKYLLIPKGSKLLGKYDSTVAYGQERILIAFDRIVRPDGSSIQLSNFTGGNAAGESGFEGNVDNHWGKILGAATISTMLSFGAGVAADHNSTNTYYPGAQQSGILGAANSVSQVGQSLTNRAIDIQPTLTVPQGFNFTVIVNKDMILEPYAGKTL